MSLRIRSAGARGAIEVSGQPKQTRVLRLGLTNSHRAQTRQHCHSCQQTALPLASLPTEPWGQ